MLVIGFLCLAPSDEFEMYSIEIPYLDKAVHFTMFLFLAFFAAGTNKKWPNQFHKYGIPVIAILYGLLIEYLQWKYTSSRSGDWHDVAADTIGFFTGLWLFLKLKPKWQQWFH